MPGKCRHPLISPEGIENVQNEFQFCLEYSKSLNGHHFEYLLKAYKSFSNNFFYSLVFRGE